MMKKLFRRLLDDMVLRLSLTALFVTLPLVFASSWLAAAYQDFMGNGKFLELMWRLLLSSFMAAFLAGSIILVPTEKLLIREKAIDNAKWRALRVLAYLIAGIPIGLATLFGIRAVIGRYGLILESSYIASAIVFSGAVGTIYSFIEQAAEDVKKREEELENQIRVLRIEIDEMKREHQVAEIVQTDYFQDLQDRARKMRKPKKK